MYLRTIIILYFLIGTVPLRSMFGSRFKNVKWWYEIWYVLCNKYLLKVPFPQLLHTLLKTPSPLDQHWMVWGSVGQKRDLAGYKINYIIIVGTKTWHKQQYTYNWQKLRRRLRATPEQDRYWNPSLTPPFLTYLEAVVPDSSLDC
jgi:hypothetical protein